MHTVNGGGISNRPVRGYRQGLQTGATGRVRQVRQRGTMYLCGRIPEGKVDITFQQGCSTGHHNLTTKPATFLVGLWCKCGGCVGQLCGGVVVGLWAFTPPHPPHTIATPALPYSTCFRPPHFMFNVSPPPHPTPRTH